MSVRAGNSNRTLLAPRYRHLFESLLCKVDVRNDPTATYEALLDFEPPVTDFLLPHGTWNHPPPGRVPGAVNDTPCADWLFMIFDRWYPARRTSVPMFESIMKLPKIGPPSVDSVGLIPRTSVVIETAGTVKQSNTLKVAYPMWATCHITGLRMAADYDLGELDSGDPVGNQRPCCQVAGK
ncbi:MAG: hypothetical protein ACRDP7_13475 [Trebonia sp.]